MTPLEQSIAHWERMRNDPGCREEPYGDDCALCDAHYDGNKYATGHQCDGCPVAAETGHPNCSATPHGVAAASHASRRKGPKAWTRWQLAATAEIEFLRSLLPKS